MNKIVKIKYLPNSPHLEMSEKGDWVDLYTYEDVTLNAGESTIISLGVSMQLPRGYEAHVAPRSSTFKRWGIIQTNSVGVIDSSFSGDGDVWGMPVYATQPVIIPKGTRLCQFRIIESQPTLVFKEVSHLGADRGGFGSTGA